MTLAVVVRPLYVVSKLPSLLEGERVGGGGGWDEEEVQLNDTSVWKVGESFMFLPNRVIFKGTPDYTTSFDSLLPSDQVAFPPSR